MALRRGGVVRARRSRRYLAEARMCFNELFDGFTVTRFDRPRVIV